MKENKYDDESFFRKYGEMGRSKEGLIAAGEWETMKALLPDFKGKRMLDIGCGYGWHCIYAVERGARSVVGVDISQRMLEVARKKTSYPEIEYLCAAMEDMDFPPESFDIILSSLALHYTESYSSIVKKAYSYLKPEGVLVFSVEHPVFTAYGTQDWHRDDKGNIMHFPVDNYFYDGKRNARFLGEEVVKYHRTLTTYINELLTNGFEILRMVEPMPAPWMLESMDGMRDELRRPMMLIVSAAKPNHRGS